VVLVPTHKSYFDFLIVTYIHYYYQIELPYTCGPEDMLNIAFVTYILKSGGGFFLNSQHLSSDLFIAVLKAYTRALLGNNCVV
jgi:glycerone phosphate O-acyltransferase